MTDFEDFGGKGPLVHFSHANGYPPQSYRQLIDLLTPNHHVIASYHRPLWRPPLNPKEVTSWHDLADDLILYLDTRVKQKVYGVGHSLGAVVTLFAAIKRPDLFKGVILIEPVIMPARIMFVFGLSPLFIKKKIPIIKKALSRVDTWDSKQDAFDFHRKKRVFQKISDQALWDYIDCGTELAPNNLAPNNLAPNNLAPNKSEDGKKVTLTFSKAWEVHCYTLMPNLWPYIDKCPVPVLGIRGGDSDVLLPSAWQRWQRKTPSHQFVEIPETSHLLPFENPKAITDLIVRMTSG